MEKLSVFDELIKRYHENKLAHAFLLETNSTECCYNDVLNFVKTICDSNNNENYSSEVDINELIDNDSLPSLITIEADGLNIKKEQILDMMERFSTRPVFTKFNIYIIKGAERLNQSSANTLLKFLEEPEDNILGIFITNNKENVISTVRSRCQLFNCLYDFDISSDMSSEVLMDIKLYLNAIYKNKEDLLYNRTHMVGFYKERVKWENFFNMMLYYLKDCYTSNRVDKIDMVREVSKENLVKIIVLVETVIKYIKRNGNIDLILDKFVIEMREYYE